MLTFMAALAALSSFGSAEQSAEAIVASRWIERARPCSALKLEQKTPLGKVAIGVDEFRGASVEHFDARLLGDTLSLETTATVACQTPPDAMLKGDALAQFQIGFQGDLDACTVGDIRVDITKTGGNLAGGIDALKSTIEARLKKQVGSEFLKACQTLHGETSGR